MRESFEYSTICRSKKENLEIHTFFPLPVPKISSTARLTFETKEIAEKRKLELSCLVRVYCRLSDESPEEGGCGFIMMRLDPQTAVRVVHLGHGYFCQVKIDADPGGDLPSPSKGLKLLSVLSSPQRQLGRGFPSRLR